MNFLKQKPPGKTIVYASLIFLLAGVVVAILFNNNNATDAATASDWLFTTTPTPYPLPTRVYDSPSYFTTIFGQIFRKGNQPVDPSQIVKDGQKQTGNEYLDLYAVNNYSPVGVQWWQQESKQVYEYVSKRLDTTVSEKIIVTLVPPKSGNCAPRGTTFHEQPPVIMIFADQDTGKEQILAVLAHELGHVFIHQKYENLGDLALTEGMATWAAGEYWKEWKGVDFNSGVRAFIENGTYLSLSQNYDLEKAYDDNSSDCIPQRDILLTELASFLDYLTQNYEAEQLAALLDTRQSELINDQRVVYPPNFKDVYGLELNQLEYEWLKTLLSSLTPP